MKNENRKHLYTLTECAVLIALAAALSLIKLWKMPLGGSVTPLSMLPICLISVMFGLRWGLGSAFVYAIIQLMFDLPEAMGWGLTPAIWVGMILFDYLVAFTVLGLAGIFRRKKELGALLGTCLAMFLRFVSHVISGTIFFDIWMPENWSSPFLYAISYNGLFMLPELIMTGVTLFFLLKISAVKNLVFEQNGLPFTKVNKS
ncbi:MAG: energy-coupled thiamine transporter ThiT [Clostridia bacterium]|nr:energy-coupled thiamine transporter ThiT [Clostridia bacterium]